MNTDMDIDINAVTGTDTITCRLVEARADLGITQKELATATGISLKTIANIEAKQHIPSLLYAMRIADFFHKPVTSLFCYHPGVQQTPAKGDDPNEQ
jgi:DNA-binding XRE family transcriptional regulator